ncbi:MAG: hypothetical protein AAF387_15345 [Pseudomonadota bacterium]
MAGILNNPKFVLLLAGSAFGIVGYNVVLPLMAPAQESLADAVPPVGLEESALALSEPPASIDENTTVNSTVERISTPSSLANIGWGKLEARDPFKFTAEVAEKSSDPLSSEPIQLGPESAAATEIAPANIDVAAIAIGSHFKLAVVGGELVRPGQRLAGTAIAEMQASNIRIQDNSGETKQVPLPRTATGYAP